MDDDNEGPTLFSKLNEEDYFDDVGNQTVPEYLLPRVEKAKSEGKIHWIIDTVAGSGWTYEEFENLTRRIGSSMYKRGLRKGDTVLYMTYDMFYIHVLFVGVWRANGMMRASYPEDDEETLLNRVEESRVGWILCEPEASKMCLSVTSKIYWDVEVIVIGKVDGCTPITDILSDDGSELPECKITGSDIAIILCTSGTTGKSKGAVHTHHSLLNQMMSIRHLLMAEKPNLILSKGTHVTGSTFPLGGIASGKTCLVMGKITKTNLFKGVEEYKPGMIFGFPSFLLLLVNEPEVNQYDFSSLEVATTGGAPVTPSIENTLLQLPNLKVLINSYGLTEVLPITSECDLSFPITSKYFDTPPFSIGKVFVGVTVQIRDIDTHKVLGPNQSGEIWVKSKSLIDSYYKNPEETERAFTDGWFKTGDVAYYDENQFLFLVDRIKEIFKYYNNHISPTELEEVIANHPNVAEVCVVGVIDPNGGDRIPRAFVKLKIDQGIETCTAEEIQEYANNKLPDYKQLRGGLYIVDDFLIGKTGKVSRQLMEKLPISSEKIEN